LTGDLPNNATQTHRLALIDPNNQPDKIPDLVEALLWFQFPNSTIPGIKDVVEWRRVTPFLDFL
jgi:hypothetical protein